MSNPQTESVLARLRAVQGKTTQQTTQEQAQPSVEPTPKPTQANTSQHEQGRTDLKPESKPTRTGRKWKEADYRIRGLKTPEERRQTRLEKLYADVLPETSAKIRAYAIENALTLGQAVDQLIVTGGE